MFHEEQSSKDSNRLASPHLPRPGIQASMSYFLAALAPSSSLGISKTLASFSRCSIRPRNPRD
jgi:hypothetical protein